MASYTQLLNSSIEMVLLLSSSIYSKTLLNLSIYSGSVSKFPKWSIFEILGFSLKAYNTSSLDKSPSWLKSMKLNI